MGVAFCIACSTAASSLKYIHERDALSPSDRSATSTIPESSSLPDGTGTDDDNRLAERDDDHQPVTLDEVRRSDHEAFGGRHPRRHPEDSRCQRPDDPLDVPTQYPADEHEPCGRNVERHHPENRSDLGKRGSLHVHAGVQQDDDEISDPERKPLSLRRVGHSKCDDEEAAHPTDQQEPVAQVIGVDRVGQPGIAVVHPPDNSEHHDDLHDRGAVAAVHEHPG